MVKDMMFLSLLLMALSLTPNCLAASNKNTFVTIDQATITANEKLIDIASSPQPSVSNKPLIAYGKVASVGQFPFMASLQIAFGNEDTWPQVTIDGKNYSVPASFHTCGASLIWPNLILSAGHCLGSTEFPIVPNFALIGGTIVQTNPNTLPITNAPEKFVISGYTRHPKYQLTPNDEEAYNDIAILRLSGLSTQPHVNLSTTVPPKGQVLTALGWGATPNNEEEDGMVFGSEILMYTDYKVSSSSDLAPSGGSSCPNFPGILCIATTPVKNTPGAYQSTCVGDSGGPQMLKGTNIQAGLTSFGPNGCGNATWEAETNIAYYYNSFIWPTIVNYGLPSPVKSKSQCKTWKAVAEAANIVYSLNGSRSIYYEYVTAADSKLCGAACLKDASCYSFSFATKTKKCSFSSVRVLAMPLVKKEKSLGISSGYLQCV